MKLKIKAIFIILILFFGIFIPIIKISKNNFNNENEINLKQDRFTPNSEHWTNNQKTNIKIDGWGEEVLIDEAAANFANAAINLWNDLTPWYIPNIDNSIKFQYQDDNNDNYPDNPSGRFDYLAYFISKTGDNSNLISGGGNVDGEFVLNLSEEYISDSNVRYRTKKVRINDFKYYGDAGIVAGTFYPIWWNTENHDIVHANSSNSKTGETLEGKELIPTINENGLINEESGADEYGWKEIYHFKDNIVHDNRGSSNGDITISYKWKEDENELRFKTSNSNDWSFFITNGGYNFVTGIDVEFQEYRVEDNANYNVSNDVMGYVDYSDKNNPKIVNEKYYDETQKNMYNANIFRDEEQLTIDELKLPHNKPYFDNNDDYYDLEEYILQNEIINSRDTLPKNGLTFQFYDYNNETKKFSPIEDKTTKLNSSLITFDIISDASESDVLSSDELNDDKYLQYHIPFVNIELDGDEHNIYNDLSNPNDPSDNEDYFEWSFNGKNWQINTNLVQNLNLKFENGIHSYQTESMSSPKILFDGQEDNLSSNSVNLLENNFNENYDEKITIFDKGDKNSYSGTNPKFLEEGEGFTFVLNQAESNDDEDSIKFITPGTKGNLDNANFEEGFEANEKVVFDVNDDGIINSNEIFYGSIVNDDTEFVSNSDTTSMWQYNLDSKMWDFINIPDNNIIPKDGNIYAIKNTDDHGNARFEVIQYLDSSLRKDETIPKLQRYEDSDLYKRDVEASELQGLNKNELLSKTNLELRALDKYINEDNMQDLDSTIINQEKIDEITNKYENGTNINTEINGISVKEEISDEIKNQLTEQGISEELYNLKLEFIDRQGVSPLSITPYQNTNEISHDTNISVEITPKGGWQVTGAQRDVFQSQSYYNLESEKSLINHDLLAEISNKFEEGIKFNEITTNIDGETTSLKKSLEENIKEQVIANEGSEKIFNNMNIDWNISDDEIINQSDMIQGKITGTSRLVKGEQDIWFNARTRKNLAKVTIDTKDLIEITNEYFSGAVFVDEMKSKLDRSINQQLVDNGVFVDEVNINWYKYNSALEEYVAIDQNTRIYNGDKLKFEIEPKSTNYLGKSIAEFSAITTTSLKDLVFDTSVFEDVTNKYESSTLFSEMNSSLNDVLQSELVKKGVAREHVDITWLVSPQTSIIYNSKLSFNIKSNDETFVTGEQTVMFNSMTYYDLSKFEFDSNLINSLIEDYEEPIKFVDIREKLDSVIIKELEDQNYYIEFINIQWNYTDDEWIKPGTELEMSLKTDNEKIIHGEFSMNFKFGIEPISTGTSILRIVLYILLGLTGLIILTLIGLMIYKRFKSRKI